MSAQDSQERRVFWSKLFSNPKETNHTEALILDMYLSVMLDSTFIWYFVWQP